jgi:type II secretory ATPase GspE/PulE/Tfp pilus assembly ATPase PilB-like protein
LKRKSLTEKGSVLIGQMLIESGLITPEQLEAGLHEQGKTGGFICSVLNRLGFVTEEKAFSILSRQLNIPYTKISRIAIEPSVINMVPAGIATHYKIIPLDFKDNILAVATADPLDIHAIDELQLFLKANIKPILSTESDIQEAILRYYGLGAETIEKILGKREFLQDADKEKIEDINATGENASIITFVNQIFSEAIKDRATDIHLEPYHDELRIRFRIDGVLYDINMPQLTKDFHSTILSRIKIMARLDIAERRLPQDGRIKIKVENEELDLRISTLPTIFGEAVHIRILNCGVFLELEKLGILSPELKIIEDAIKKPHGIIFVTGPTGSGKSTTLYACMKRINSSGIKIITVEDPVEYQLKGINQLQVNPHIGFNFASALRHILRHDPDVMMVGEVRDTETSEIAIRAALTGHLVLSTIHTNNAAGAVTRLLDMGIEPFLLSSSLECLVAQRLVRLICQKCKMSVKLTPEMASRISRDFNLDSAKAEVFEGKGCQECRFTGYRGRTGIYEVLKVSDALRELILKRASSQEIKNKAMAEGMHTLYHDGFTKVFMGLTTFAEIMRVTQKEEAGND